MMGEVVVTSEGLVCYWDLFMGRLICFNSKFVSLVHFTW